MTKKERRTFDAVQKEVDEDLAFMEEQAEEFERLNPEEAEKHRKQVETIEEDWEDSQEFLEGMDEEEIFE